MMSLKIVVEAIAVWIVGAGFITWFFMGSAAPPDVPMPSELISIDSDEILYEQCVSGDEDCIREAAELEAETDPLVQELKDLARSKEAVLEEIQERKQEESDQ